jgi:hypothetical protein
VRNVISAHQSCALAKTYTHGRNLFIKFSASTPKLLFLREYPVRHPGFGADGESFWSRLCFFGVGVMKLIAEAKRNDLVE